MIKAPDFNNPSEEQLRDLETDEEFLGWALALFEKDGDRAEARSVKEELSLVRMRKNRMKNLISAKKNAAAATTANIIPFPKTHQSQFTTAEEGREVPCHSQNNGKTTKRRKTPWILATRKQ